MQLYSSPISPYASRVRIQIHHKNLPVQIVPPPGGLGSAQLKSDNPIGKIPVLNLGERKLAESFAIMEFLESQYPQPPMVPAEPYELARMRELVRFVDLQLAPTMFPMFLALRGKAGPEQVKDAVAGMAAQMQILEHLIARKSATTNPAFDLADAALLPILWYARVLYSHFGKADCLAPLPATTRWWQSASAVPAAAMVLGELETGLRAAVPALFQ